MKNMNRLFRFLSVLLIVTLTIGFATPGRAEAIEPLTIVAIAGVAVIVIVVVVYLIVANMHESQQGKRVQGEPRYLACVDSDVAPGNCWAMSELPASGAQITIPSTVVAAATQSP